MPLVSNLSISADRSVSEPSLPTPTGTAGGGGSRRGRGAIAVLCVWDRGWSSGGTMRAGCVGQLACLWQPTLLPQHGAALSCSCHVCTCNTMHMVPGYAYVCCSRPGHTRLALCSPAKSASASLSLTGSRSSRVRLLVSSRTCTAPHVHTLYLSTQHAVSTLLMQHYFIRRIEVVCGPGCLSCLQDLSCHSDRCSWYL